VGIKYDQTTRRPFERDVAEPTGNSPSTAPVCAKLAERRTGRTLEALVMVGMRRVRGAVVAMSALGFELTVATTTHAQESAPAHEQRVEFVLEPNMSLRVVGPAPAVTCTGSCTRTLPEGVYTVSLNRGDEFLATQSLYVWESQRVRVEPPNRGAHTAGAILGYTFGGIFGVSALVFTTAFVVATPNLMCAAGGACSLPEWVPPALAVGGIGMAGSIVPATVGLVMMNANKSPSIHTEPLRTGSRRAAPRASARESLGVGLHFAF
jgi:hypothetical protein